MIASAVGHQNVGCFERQRGLQEIALRHGPYLARFAFGETDIAAALRLRFEVFNLELNEGLESAYESGHDSDEFDAICDHLIVEYLPSRQVVGTYRLQTGVAAGSNLGYYSEREFDFSPYEAIRSELVELGRDCIHRDHRSTDVLYLLWRGIAHYAVRCGGRYLVGCSSLTSQDPAHGFAVYESLRSHLVSTPLRTHPQSEFAMPPVPFRGATSHVPRLLCTYLAI